MHMRFDWIIYREVLVLEAESVSLDSGRTIQGTSEAMLSRFRSDVDQVVATEALPLET